MSTELTNLLPERRKKRLRRQYFLRLGTVALLLLTVLTVFHGVLLMPTYLYARNEVVRGRTELANLSASAQNTGESGIAPRQELLKTTAENLAHLQSTPTASTAMKAVLQVSRLGISLTGFTFTAPSGSTSARMQVTGIASSRDALRQYAAALGQLPFVTSADLPISAYAQEANIEFTITLSGTLRP
ncbi:MAG TPA: hypothetical protein VJA87_00915 [Candidatus Paceibacterota bacterium]